MVTDWEVGQILVHLSDEIAERSADIKQSHPKVFAMLQECRLTIGDSFNKEPFVTSHGFGLPSHPLSAVAESRPLAHEANDGDV